MRYRWFVCLFFLTVSTGFPASAQDSGQKWQQVYDAGIAAAEAGDYAKAERKLRQALNLARKFGDADSRHAESVGDLGAVLFLQQRYDEARPFLERGLVLHKTTLGAHEKTGNAAHWMGDFYLTVGEYEKAVEVLQYTVDVRRKAAVPEDDGTIAAYKLLGMALRHAGRDAEAVGPLMQAVELQEASPTVARSDVANSRDWYGTALYSSGRYREAAEQHQRAIDTWKKTGGEDASIAYALGRLGNAHVKLGNDLEAKAAYLDEVKTCDRVFGETSKESLGALRRLLAFYKPRNKPTMVAHIEGRIARITGEPAPGQSGGQQPAAASDVPAGLVDALKPIPALVRYQNIGKINGVEAMLGTEYSANSWKPARDQAKAAGDVEYDRKNYAKAYDHYAEALYICFGYALGDARWTVGESFYDVAFAAWGLGKMKEAEDMFLRGINEYKRLQDQVPEGLRNTYVGYASLLKAQGRTQEAAQMEARATAK